MNEKTPIKQIIVSADRAWVKLEDGHIVSHHVYQKILKHAIKEVEKHIVYKIEKTVYFVMRGDVPA